MKLRKADKHDIPAIMTLYRQLFKEMAEMQPFYIKEANQDTAFLEMTIEQNDSDILIADIDGTVGGFALVMMQETPSFSCIVAHRYAYLADLITNPNYRGKGVAHALMQELEVWAKENSADYLELSVLSNNPNAIRLYEKVGYQQTTHTYRKQL